MDPNMRKRGWSISSLQDNNNNNTSSRPRANTDHSEDTLTAAEKQELLNDFPTDELNNDDEECDRKNQRDDNDDDDEEDELEMFGDDSSSSSDEDDDDDDNNQPKKKRKLNNKTSTIPTPKKQRHGEDENENNSKDDQQDDQQDDVEMERQAKLEEAKKRLSKWSQRLFDPDRPRGLVQAPEVIPLNDEFLTQFGKREKELDKAIGRDIGIHVEDLDEAIDAEENGNDENDNETETKTKKSSSAGKGHKVKIANLSYTTSKLDITRTCERYGPVLEVQLPMDENNDQLSKGRAFITFENSDDRDKFVKNMNEKSLGGRIVRVLAMSDDTRKRTRDNGARPSSGVGGGALARYYKKDITTKCFRCGQVGHMSGQCPNEEQQKPCPLCAKTGHDSYSCPLSKICFNCGVPGHINRECPERRGIPRRMVCTTCFVSGHHRYQCRERGSNIPSYNATCLVCGKTGHFMCEQMRWFFGLKGISCHNCGMADHHGSQCDRPSVDQCVRSGEVVLQELERAESMSLMEELENSRNKDSRRGDSRQRQRDNDYSRSKSQPPSKFHVQEQSSSYGRISFNGNRNSYQDERGRKQHRRDDDYVEDDRGRSRHRSNRNQGNQRHGSRSHSGKRGYK